MVSKHQPKDGSASGSADIRPEGDLPPPYTPVASTAPATKSQDDDPYAFLSNYDTIFLIDDSSSMMTDGRWAEAEQAIRSITPICTTYDSDGIDIYFLNHKASGNRQPGKADGGYYGIKSASAVSQVFRGTGPSGATPTGQRLRSILRPYLQTLESASDPDEVKPINIIVITDGAATDEPEEVIVNVARRLDALDASPSQVGIQFFQVGNVPSAAESLRHLDDDLKSRGVRDMVDTCTWDELGKRFGRSGLTSKAILKVVLGAVLRRLDNQSLKAGSSRRRGVA